MEYHTDGKKKKHAVGLWVMVFSSRGLGPTDRSILNP